MSHEFGKDLKRIRQLKALSLRDVEKETGISNAYLSQLERGDAKNPSPQKLASLASFYKIPYEALMELAGYLGTPNLRTPLVSAEISARAISVPDNSKLSPLQLVLMNAELSEEDEELIAEYITFISSRRREKLG